VTVSADAPRTVAVVQAPPIVFDREATVEKAGRLIGEAASHGASLIAFPEAWVTGYPVRVYGAAGWEDPAAKRVHGRFLASAVSVPSDATDTLCKAARANRMEVVIGINERAQDGAGTIYNSLLYVGSDGTLRGVHRKLIPTHGERLVWGQGDGSTLHVIDTPVGRVGGLVCWEHWMPLVRFTMHVKAEQIHVAVWPEAGDMEQLASRHYAFEGRCFVICAGTVLTRGDLPPDFELGDALSALGPDIGEDGVLLRGGSGVIGPDGQWLVGPAGLADGIVYAQIDLSHIAEEQLALDGTGHYHRPDLFQLTVDERPRPSVVWLRDEDAGP
jgi:predicted amidohydrolase